MTLLEHTAAQDDFRMDYDLQPGDMQFINNHTILHARSAFQDWEELEDGGKRHLLRTWISPSNGRSACITHVQPLFPGCEMRTAAPISHCSARSDVHCHLLLLPCTEQLSSHADVYFSAGCLHCCTLIWWTCMHACVLALWCTASAQNVKLAPPDSSVR